MTSAAGRIDEARGRRDRDQAGDRAGDDAEHARLPWPIHSANIQASAAAAVAIWVAAIAMPARPSAATAEPALKPNQPTQSSEAPITDRTRLCGAMLSVPIADALAEHQRADEAGDAGIDMHDRAAGEVEHAQAAEEAAAPDPMGDRAVDEDAATGP